MACPIKLLPLLPGPPQVGNVIASELAERFCFYGSRSVLTLYLTDRLGYSEASAVGTISAWVAACYLSPLLGGYLSDSHLGRYTTIVAGSAVYVVGSTVLAASAYEGVPDALARGGLYLGLGAIALATGGIKTSVAPFGADQITDEADKTSYFFVFYQAINVGSLLAYVIVPLARSAGGFGAAFTVPAGFLVFSVLIFLAARGRYVHVPTTGSVLSVAYRVGMAATFPRWTPSGSGGGGGGGVTATVAAGRASTAECSPLGRGQADAESTPLMSPAGGPTPGLPPTPPTCKLAVVSPLAGRWTGTWLDRARGRVADSDVSDMHAVSKLLPIYLTLPFFWMVYESYSAVWTLQARRMDLCLGSLLCLQPETVQTLNPLLVVTLIPFFDRVLMPALAASRYTALHPTPLRRMTAGMFLAGASWVAAGLVEAAVVARGPGAKLSFLWQLPQYVIITCAEICVSTTGLEFSYREAPERMKGVVLALWYVTSSAGNAMNAVLYNSLGRVLDQQGLMWVSVGLMFGAAVVFAFLAGRYKERGGGDGGAGAFHGTALVEGAGEEEDDSVPPTPLIVKGGREGGGAPARAGGAGQGNRPATAAGDDDALPSTAEGIV